MVLCVVVDIWCGEMALDAVKSGCRNSVMAVPVCQSSLNVLVLRCPVW